MIGFITIQEAIGIFIAGLIVGWFMSIGLAYRIARRGDSELWQKILEKRRHDDNDC